MNQDDKEEMFLCFRMLVNFLACLICTIFFLNSTLTGQVVPQPISYLVPLGVLLILKVGSK